MLEFITEAKVLIMQREDLWMIIDEINKLALVFTCHITSVPIFNLKGRQLISAWKSKCMAFSSGLGPKDGFSLEVGGVLSDVVDSTCSDLTLMELGATGEKDMWMLSPCLSMLYALYALYALFSQFDPC